MTEPATGGALIARTLATLGVKDVFALHGGHLDAFLVACPDEGIRLTDFRHEASAATPPTPTPVRPTPDSACAWSPPAPASPTPSRR